MTSPQRLRALLLPLLALSACDVLSSRDAAPEASASAMTKASSDPQAARVVSPAADAVERAQQAMALPEPDATARAPDSAGWPGS